MKSLTIATRGSRLALWQAEHVAGLIRSAASGVYPDLDIRLSVVKTQGDIIQDVPLSKVGGKGLFVKEIEEALLDGRADIAVHSMKDVPMELPAGLVIGVMPPREDPADIMLAVDHPGLSVLASGSAVGTSSLRRQAQLLAIRPDIKVVSLRGNVDTRLRKLQEGQFDAVIMAAAGMKRLGLSAPYMERLSPDMFLPAAGQGALGIEFCADRQDLAELLAPLENSVTRLCVEAERGFLAGLNGGCQVPIAAYAVVDDDGVTLDGLVARIDGSEIIRRRVRSAPGAVDAASMYAMGQALAAEVFENGGRSVLNALMYENA